MSEASQQTLQVVIHKIHRDLDAWRHMRRRGCIITFTETAFAYSAGRESITPAQVNEMASYMNCAWAFNPMNRLYYLIPNELFGDTPETISF